MRDVAIIGAGELGGSLAYVLARRDVASTIRLIDETGTIAAGKSLDIMQAAPIERFATVVSGSTDLTTAAGAALIFIADSAGDSAGRPSSGDPEPKAAEWQGENGLLLLKRIALVGAPSIIVCAGASQRELIDRGVRELKFARERLFGSAPEALAAAVRAIVAVETGGSPRDVALTVLGVPPTHVVVPWEQATIGGFAVTSVLDQPTLRRLAARVAPLWPPGPHALAWAAATAAEAIFGRSRRTMAAFVAPDDSSGRRMRTGALPIRIGATGILRIESPVLNTHDRVALDNAMLL